MHADSKLGKTRGDMLREVLLNYLLASKVVGWPGVDGFTEDDILNFYPLAAAAGKVPARLELSRIHTDLIGEIQSLFTLKGW